MGTGIRNILVLPMESDEASGLRPGEPEPLLDDTFDEHEPAFSPDGRWLAYVSNESGRDQIYVRAFPGPEGKWLVSTEGGNFPTWSPDGTGILYFDALQRRIMVSRYTVEGEAFRPARPEPWSDAQIEVTPRRSRPRRKFDLHPDGERVAVLSFPEGAADEKRNHVTFIFNFFDELERLAPAE